MPRSRKIGLLSGFALILGIVVWLTMVPDRNQQPGGDRLIPMALADIPGWSDDAVTGAIAALSRSCKEIVETGRGFAKSPAYGGLRQDWTPLCTVLLAQDATAMHDTAARQFLEEQFDAYEVVDATRPQGLFTGYYEPQAEGSLTRTGAFTVPVYARPDDLVRFDAATRNRTGLGYGRLADAGAVPYYTRREIEEGALDGRGLEILWLKSWADLFFMQIQGSGRVKLTDGSIVRLSYAAKNGRDYTPIGAVLADRGEIDLQQLSMQTIRAWMDAHPDQARDLMWRNDSYVFFAVIDVPDPAMGPPGAQLAGLTAGRSLAVDPSYWAYGTPVFLDTEIPNSDGTEHRFRQLLIAQDTGSAIRGLKRGDIFFGSGDEATWAAGHMKAPAAMYVLLPKSVSARLGLDNRRSPGDGA